YAGKSCRHNDREQRPSDKHPEAKRDKEQQNWREDDGARTGSKELAQTFDHVHAGLQPAVERARCRDRNQEYKAKNCELHDERLSCLTDQAECLPGGCRSRLTRAAQVCRLTKRSESRARRVRPDTISVRTPGLCPKLPRHPRLRQADRGRRASKRGPSAC